MDNNAKKYTYFVTGGGTGGHIYPAVAVIDALLADETTQDVYYVGNPENLEFEIAKKKGYKFLPVIVHAMPRKPDLRFIKWGFGLIAAWLKCYFYIKKYKPDAVFGTGGYVSAPVLMGCLSFTRGMGKKTPYMIHDCDAQPGIVSRKFAPCAKNVSLAFEGAKQFINNEFVQVNGNPIRKEFSTITKEDARKKLGLEENKITLCIMGGSQGARAINDAAVDLLKELTHEMNLQVIFQTGKKNFERVIEQLLKVYPEYEKDKNLILKPYFDDMVSVMKATDIAISRSGSLSLSEICASGVAPILVPFPHAAADHQRKNAKYLVEKEAAIYIEDADVTKQSLKHIIIQLLENRERLDTIRMNAMDLAKFDGAEDIKNQLKQIARGG